MKINVHHIYGTIFVALGAITANLNTLHAYVTDKTYGLVTIGIGVGTAVFGFLNKSS